MGRMGLTSEEHNAIHNSDYNTLIQNLLSPKTDPIIMDMCCGGGRDIVMMHNFSKKSGKNTLGLCIDSALDKFNDASMHFPNRFARAYTIRDVERIHGKGMISFVIDKLPELAISSTLTKPSTPKVDFLLCNAGIMFIDRDHLKPSLQKMAMMLSTKRRGQLLIGFSTKRPKENMHSGDQRYSEVEVDNRLKSIRGIQIEKLPDIKDTNRDFYWHYRLITRTP